MALSSGKQGKVRSLEEKIHSDNEEFTKRSLEPMTDLEYLKRRSKWTDSDDSDDSDVEPPSIIHEDKKISGAYDDSGDGDGDGDERATGLTWAEKFVDEASDIVVLSTIDILFQIIWLVS